MARSHDIPLVDEGSTASRRPYPDVGLPGKRPKAGLVPSDNSSLSDGSSNSGNTAAGVIHHRAPVYVRMRKIVLNRIKRRDWVLEGSKEAEQGRK